MKNCVNMWINYWSEWIWKLKQHYRGKMKLKTRGDLWKSVLLSILKCVSFFIPRVIHVHAIFFFFLLPRQVSEVLYEDLQCWMIIIGPVRYYADGMTRSFIAITTNCIATIYQHGGTGDFPLSACRRRRSERLRQQNRQRKHQKTSEILLEHIWRISRSNAL